VKRTRAQEVDRKNLDTGNVSWDNALLRHCFSGGRMGNLKEGRHDSAAIPILFHSPEGELP
jgi:hypothetical protein